MSDKCGNCDCADKSQKKGTSYGVVIVEAEKSDDIEGRPLPTTATALEDATAAAGSHCYRLHPAHHYSQVVKGTQPMVA
uniref:Uncharacterized protein n=1 Tax=Oryza sativa subsp. japonica TaxID=39947 RepID=Q6YW14_ORYSJ|nr:hypothetical protein [Oryza sativa Japonica Group]